MENLPDFTNVVKVNVNIASGYAQSRPLRLLSRLVWGVMDLQVGKVKLERPPVKLLPLSEPATLGPDFPQCRSLFQFLQRFHHRSRAGQDPWKRKINKVH